MKPKKWKEFENETHRIISELNPQDKIYKNVYLDGKLSKIKRQVDVQQFVKVNDYNFIVFECKDHKKPLDIEVLEAFNTKLKDVGAKTGAIVSNSSYSKAMLNMADQLKIDLLHLVDTKNKEIRGKLYASMMITDIYVKSLSIRWSPAPVNQPLSFPNDPVIVADDGNGAPASEIFNALWNFEKTSLPQRPGRYRYQPPNVRNKKVVDLISGEPIPLQQLEFVYEVKAKNFAGQIEIIDAQGIYNVQTQGFQTRSMITESVNAAEVEKVWPELTEEEAAKHHHTFGLEAISMRPSPKL